MKEMQRRRKRRIAREQVTKRRGLGGRRCKEEGGETEWGNKLQSKRFGVGGRIGIKDKAVQACDATQGKDWLDEENKM